MRIRGTIKDTDTADWSLSLAPVEITEGRAETGAVTVSVSKAHERAQTVTLELSGAAVEGTDYTIGSRSLTLAPRAAFGGDRDFASLYNGEDSNDKTVIVTAKRDDGGEVIGTQTLTIRNNDTRPGAPVGLSAGADGADRIDLSWTAPEDAGGLPVTGYLIEVSEDAGNNWRDVVEDTGVDGNDLRPHGSDGREHVPLPGVGEQRGGTGGSLGGGFGHDGGGRGVRAERRGSGSDGGGGWGGGLAAR